MSDFDGPHPPVGKINKNKDNKSLIIGRQLRTKTLKGCSGSSGIEIHNFGREL